MVHDSRNNGIVDPEGEIQRDQGHHSHHGHHCLWNEPCNDPRVLMYIDDNSCTQDGAVMGAQGQDEHGRHMQDDAGLRQMEVEDTAPVTPVTPVTPVAPAAPVVPVVPVQSAQQGNAESAARYQGWPQGNTENAANNQGWAQGNAENAAHYQGWAQGNAENAARNPGWQQGNAENAAQAQGFTGGAACGQARPGVQFHVHEVLGSVEIAEPQSDPHNHRFVTVSGEARPWGNANHYHDVRFRTDFYEDHFHEGWGRTGGAIQVGDKHVHFLEAVTTQNDGHMHRYKVATMIENPIGD